MTREIEIRLLGHRSADGELLASDAIGLIAAFKDVTYRLTRAVADRAGLGRTDADLEKLATVRVGLRPGSTRVVFSVGDEAALDIEDPISSDVDRVFWSIVHGMSLNERPSGVSRPVADAVDRLILALSKAAPAAEVVASGRRAVHLTTREVSREPWQDEPAMGEHTILHGVLEMVDLHSSRFRLRDVAGNAIDLTEVADAVSVAHLVGERVTVEGMLSIGVGTQHHKVEHPLISRAEEGYVQPIASGDDLDGLIAVARQLPEPPDMDLSDDELDDFLAELRA